MIAYIAESRGAAQRIFTHALPDHNIDHHDKVWTPARTAPIGIIVWEQSRLLGLELSGYVDLDGSLVRNPDLRHVLFARLMRNSFADHMMANMRPHFFMGIDRASNEPT